MILKIEKIQESGPAWPEIYKISGPGIDYLTVESAEEAYRIKKVCKIVSSHYENEISQLQLKIDHLERQIANMEGYYP